MNEIRNQKTSMKPAHRLAIILILIAQIGYIAWGGMAALFTDHLLGPGSSPILPAEYLGYTGHSWSELTSASPQTADFITLIFRMYGAYCAIFGLLTVVIAATAFRKGERWAWWTLLIGNTLAYGLAMTYDRIVGAIGLFEMTEYLGIAVIYLALGLTIRFATGRGVESSYVTPATV